MPENNAMTTVVDTFPLPEELAKNLSNLLTKQTIRERLLMQNINDPETFEKIEDMLVPITAQIEAIKMQITEKHVPEKYRHPIFSWNYNGWAVDENHAQILQQVM